MDKHADKWEQEVYKVTEKPYADMPLYTVKPHSGGRSRTLHRNLLLPIPFIDEEVNEAVQEDNSDGGE